MDGRETRRADGRPLSRVGHVAHGDVLRVAQALGAGDRRAFLAECGGVRAIATRGSWGRIGPSWRRFPPSRSSPATASAPMAIDLDCARGRGVRVTNTPDVLTEDVADMAIALALAAMRGLRPPRPTCGPADGRARISGSRAASTAVGSASPATAGSGPRSRGGPWASGARSGRSAAPRPPSPAIATFRTWPTSRDGATCWWWPWRAARGRGASSMRTPSRRSDRTASW